VGNWWEIGGKLVGNWWEIGWWRTATIQFPMTWYFYERIFLKMFNV
jgi:hypothetical protein